ncbi:hypothetical protein DA2_1767 [Desulfovibrio sp. A2]|nr:hypothetical protein DA2_1767 [Desulfovibrio sp. A2]
MSIGHVGVAKAEAGARGQGADPAGGPRISGPNRRAFGLLKRVFKKVNSLSTHCNKSSSP